jgi:hypothetical protein
MKLAVVLSTMTNSWWLNLNLMPISQPVQHIPEQRAALERKPARGDRKPDFLHMTDLYVSIA